MLLSENRYTAKLFYLGRLDQEFSGDVLSQLLVQLHLCASTLSSGASGTIVDEKYQKLVHSCTYNSAE